jgi:HKD family nuclease
MVDALTLRDAIVSFAPNRDLRAALFLTFTFDGRWFEEAIVPELCERPVATFLVIRDRNATTTEAPNFRFTKAKAGFSSVFHPKLVLLVATDCARAIITSANMTRSSFERNRELGQAFELDAANFRDRSVFVELLTYVQQELSREVIGYTKQQLVTIAQALGEVLQVCPESGQSPHSLVHSYRAPIWEQIEERLATRVIRRAAVVSPFFERDGELREDPRDSERSSSIFERVVERTNGEEGRIARPIKVFFRMENNVTELPVTKVQRYVETVECHAQLIEKNRLHAKLFLFESNDIDGRDPLNLLVHGSPNFTSSALLKSCPQGNSELAVITTLPARRSTFDDVVDALQLNSDFEFIERLDDLEQVGSESKVVTGDPPVADAVLLVAEQILVITLSVAAQLGCRVGVSFKCDGTSIPLGDAEVVDGNASIPAGNLFELDPATNRYRIRSTSIELEVFAPDGSIITRNDLPLNVDVPQEFHGDLHTGTVDLTLDEQIAREGSSSTMTYRQIGEWITKKREDRARIGRDGNAVVKVSHVADLDRFYRNIHVGLRGIMRRGKANHSSEFMLRRNLDVLTKWAALAVGEERNDLPHECRLFLVDRVLRSAAEAIGEVDEKLRNRIPTISTAIGMTGRLAAVSTWLRSVNGLDEYVTAANDNIEYLKAAIGEGPAHESNA